MLHADEAGAYAVLDVVIVVGDFVGEVRQLRLQSRLLTIDEALAHVAELDRVVVGAVLEDSLAAFEGQIQAVEFRVVLLEFVDHAQRLQVVFETAEIHHAIVERILARVAERRMPEIVGEADGLGQFLVQPQRARNRARNLRDFERMRQPGPVQIAFVIDEHLGLVDQPAKRRGMNDAVAIALIFRSVLGSGLGMAPSARMFRMSAA